MKKLVSLLLVTGCAFLLTPAHCGETTLPPQIQAQAVPLQHYLLTMGDKLNCYFTLERDDRGPHQINNSRKYSPLGITDVSDDEQITSVDALIAKLKKDFPKATFVITKQIGDDAPIVHISDIALWEQPDYVLNRKLTVKYTGLLGLLPEALGAKLKNSISSPQVMSLTEAVKGDRDTETRISINADDSTLRDILTDAVPMPSGSRVLWDAEARTQSGSEVVWVRYFKRPLLFK